MPDCGSDIPEALDGWDSVNSGLGRFIAKTLVDEGDGVLAEFGCTFDVVGEGAIVDQIVPEEEPSK